MTRPDQLRILIVDDEAPARERLADLLAHDPCISAVDQAADGVTAVQKIEQMRPHLVFLDVQMPELDGMGVVQHLGATMPLTVFVTAFDQHAIRAFEANAVDYLLKPFSDERFEATMIRIRKRLHDAQLRDVGDNMLHLLKGQVAPPMPPLDLFVVRSAGVTRFVRAVDVDWIQAAGVYVTLHASGKELLYRAALNELADRLDPARFVRIHRSAIVNLDRITHLEPASHGEFEVVLRTGARVHVSRTYRVHLERRLGQSL